MRIIHVSVGRVRMPPTSLHAPMQVVFNLSRNLAAMGHDTTIIDRKYRKADPSVEYVEGVRILRLRVPQIPLVQTWRPIRFVINELNAVLFSLSVSRHLRKHQARIDVVHVHLTSIGLILALLNRSLRSKTVYTCHLGSWGRSNVSLSALERLHISLDAHLMHRVGKVLVLNHSAREAISSVLGLDSDRVAVLPNGVDTGFFRPEIDPGEASKCHGLDSRFVILFLGRLARIKGIRELLEAANVVVNELGYKNALFLLAGPSDFDAVETPVHAGDIHEYVKSHHLEENVRFAGPLALSEVRTLIPACDLFVLPSLWESGPIVTLEAMASGKAIVATRVGDTPHQIKDGWNGYLVDPGNSRQLAEKIGRLISNQGECQRMGMNARTYAVEEFDWARIADKLAAIYQDRIVHP